MRDIYDVLPTGRLSAKKLIKLCKDTNELLTTAGAKHFVELGQRYNYYAIDVLAVQHKAWRDGDKTSQGSGIDRTHSAGLSAKQAEQAIIDAYYEFMEEVSATK